MCSVSYHFNNLKYILKIKFESTLMGSKQHFVAFITTSQDRSQSMWLAEIWGGRNFQTMILKRNRVKSNKDFSSLLFSHKECDRTSNFSPFKIQLPLIYHKIVRPSPLFNSRTFSSPPSTTKKPLSINCHSSSPGKYHPTFCLYRSVCSTSYQQNYTIWDTVFFFT